MQPWRTLRSKALEFVPPLLGAGSCALVEGIEHVESPIGFLRNVAQLLAPGGVAVIAAPNVDSFPARAKSFLAGKLRTMHERSDRTHIAPIFSDLLERQFLRRAGLRWTEHLFFPPHGHALAREPVAWIRRTAASVFPVEALIGDHHIFVCGAAT